LKLINRQHDHVVINLKQEMSHSKKCFEEKVNKIECENEALSRQVNEYKQRIDCIHEDQQTVFK